MVWPVPDTPGGLAELCDQLSAAVPETPDRPGDRPGEALGKVLDVLRCLRGERSPARVIERAAPELCSAGVFDRVMFSLVRGATWLPQAVYVLNRPGGATRELDEVVENLSVALASPLPEAEVVRRRLPALVDNAQSESRGYRPLIERTGVTEYVVAPVVAAPSVIGLLHADNAASGRPLSSVERDLLRIFADSVGLIYECAGLAERIEEQRATIADVCDAAMRSLREADTGSPAGITGPTVRAPEGGERGRVVESHLSSRLARLTPREREVLALLSSGATNSQLADRLTVAESTIKSHIKQILRKLGTGNRAGAIACYMRETRGDERRTR